MHQQLTVTGVVQPQVCSKRLAAQVNGALRLGSILTSQVQSHLMSHCSLVQHANYIEVVGAGQS